MLKKSKCVESQTESFISEVPDHKGMNQQDLDDSSRNAQPTESTREEVKGNTSPANLTASKEIQTDPEFDPHMDSIGPIPKEESRQNQSEERHDSRLQAAKDLVKDDVESSASNEANTDSHNEKEAEKKCPETNRASIEYRVEFTSSPKQSHSESIEKERRFEVAQSSEDVASKHFQPRSAAHIITQEVNDRPQSCEKKVHPIIKDSLSGKDDMQKLSHSWHQVYRQTPSRGESIIHKRINSWDRPVLCVLAAHLHIQF